ncbi:MAG: hypothetical protein MZU97_06710 [Bacillus subtilis]|nr:hypothetical protein [Bacillus subtilis]
MELWNTLASIIPYYQTNYGIDGARIDMGHALPQESARHDHRRAPRRVDPDFAFIAEELNTDNAKKAKELGYNIIIGNGFWMEPRIWEKTLPQVRLRREGRRPADVRLRRDARHRPHRRTRRAARRLAQHGRRP